QLALASRDRLTGGSEYSTLFLWNTAGTAKVTPTEYPVNTIALTLQNNMGRNNSATQETIALQIQAKNSPRRNIAIDITGGMIRGASYNNRVIGTGTTTTAHNDDIIAIPN